MLTQLANRRLTNAKGIYLPEIEIALDSRFHGASWDPNLGLIMIDCPTIQSRAEFRIVLFHELQHSIEDVGSPDPSKRTIGEYLLNEMNAHERTIAEALIGYGTFIENPSNLSSATNLLSNTLGPFQDFTNIQRNGLDDYIRSNNMNGFNIKLTLISKSDLPKLLIESRFFKGKIATMTDRFDRVEFILNSLGVKTTIEQLDWELSLAQRQLSSTGDVTNMVKIESIYELFKSMLEKKFQTLI